MNDDSFERDLAAMLAARDPGPAPASLSVAIRTRITDADAGRWSWSVRRLTGAAISTTALAAAVIVAVALFRGPVEGSGGVATPVPTGPYSLAAGDGVTSPESVPIVQIVVWLGVLAAIAYTARRIPTRLVTVAATLGVVGWIWVVANIGTSDALVHQGGIAGASPLSVRQENEPGMYIGVDGDQPFETVLTVTNASRLPLELRGLVPDPFPVDPPISPRFVGLATLSREGGPDRVRPFRPVTLEPGGSVDLAVLGKAGTCAVATPPPDRIAGGGTSLESVDLAYEQLTILHVQSVALREPIRIWWPDRCP